MKKKLPFKSKDNKGAKGKLVQDLKEAFAEVKLHKEGKIKLKTAKDLLNEL